VEKVYKTKALRKLALEIQEYNGCTPTASSLDSFWMCLIRNSTTTAPHTYGTCRMGFGKGDQNAVVDTKFRYE
jgi:choline dehydrogenase-like flavoprotein